MKKIPFSPMKGYTVVLATSSLIRRSLYRNGQNNRNPFFSDERVYGCFGHFDRGNAGSSWKLVFVNEAHLQAARCCGAGSYYRGCRMRDGCRLLDRTCDHAETCRKRVS